MATGEERLKVLKMAQEGKITAEAGVELLKALRRQQEAEVTNALR